jgi:hypothetical protein
VHFHSQSTGRHLSSLFSSVSLKSVQLSCVCSSNNNTFCVTVRVLKLYCFFFLGISRHPHLSLLISKPWTCHLRTQVCECASKGKGELDSEWNPTISRILLFVLNMDPVSSRSWPASVLSPGIWAGERTSRHPRTLPSKKVALTSKVTTISQQNWD